MFQRVHLLAPSGSSSLAVSLSPWSDHFLVFSLHFEFCQWCLGILILLAFGRSLRLLLFDQSQFQTLMLFVSFIGFGSVRWCGFHGWSGRLKPHARCIFRHILFDKTKQALLRPCCLSWCSTAPAVKLEPMTTRLRALRSTDWAKRAPAGTRNWKQNLVKVIFALHMQSNLLAPCRSQLALHPLCSYASSVLAFCSPLKGDWTPALISAAEYFLAWCCHWGPLGLLRADVWKNTSAAGRLKPHAICIFLHSPTRQGRLYSDPAASADAAQHPPWGSNPRPQG